MQKCNIPENWSVDLWDQGVCDQRNNQRCWIYASLNPIRQRLSQRLKLKQQNFQLSTNYIFYYAMLYRCEKALDAFKAGRATETEEIISSKGQWCYFAHICEKYGVVPLEIMPDTRSTLDDTPVLEELNACVGRFGEHTATRESILSEVKEILTRYLGKPPKYFGFSWRDTDNNWQETGRITPVDFLRKYGDYHISDHVMIMHHPSVNYPFNRVYCEDMTSENPYLKMLNLDMDAILPLVVKQLKDGEEVVMGSDVLQQADQKLGLLDTAAIPGNNDFTKQQRLEKKLIFARHIMTIDGVRLGEKDVPLYFKVQDSHGRKTGKDGHYTMAADWFAAYALSVVINKKHLTAEQKAQLTKEAIYMPKSERF